MRIVRCGSALAAAVALASGAVAAQTAPAVDSTWLSAQPAAKTVTFNVTAGLTTANSGMNFNGFKNGGLTLTVPTGWTVVVRFTNQDPNLPHSVAVIHDAKQIPVSAGAPVFPHAATKSPEAGLPSGAHDEFRFVAGKAGSYLIFCAVPGHGAAGMWIRLKVDDSVPVPSLAAN